MNIAVTTARALASLPDTLLDALPDTEPVAAERSAHQRIGFELGWDHAHYGLALPAAHLTEASPLGDGLAAGQAMFGARTLPASRWVRKWLQLRLAAWLRGRSVELMQVTPNYLQQIDTSHCPITRQPLADAALDAGDATTGRVRNDAGYAAGNLVMLSARAHRAKGAHGRHDAQRLARQIGTGQLGVIAGLTAGQWERVAVLCSFVEPMPHDEACAVPLLLLPPNRLRLFNPVQALQTFVSRQLLMPGWSARIRRFEALLPGAPARRAFQSFFYALLPRVLEAGRASGPLQARWAIEDAWQHPPVLRRWTAFALQLDAAECQRLLLRAHAKRLGNQRIDTFDEAQSTDGWNLASRGYVPPDAGTPCAAAPRQSSLPL